MAGKCCDNCVGLNEKLETAKEMKELKRISTAQGVATNLVTNDSESTDSKHVDEEEERACDPLRGAGYHTWIPTLGEKHPAPVAGYHTWIPTLGEKHPAHGAGYHTWIPTLGEKHPAHGAGYYACTEAPNVPGFFCISNKTNRRRPYPPKSAPSPSWEPSPKRPCFALSRSPT